MNIKEILIKKRNKTALSREEIEFFVQELVAGNLQDYHASALLMAIFLNGFSLEETVNLTRAMVQHSQRYHFNSPLYVDKHSTGGVGDKVSLILAPLLASCGVRVPMISGRSLGHTGGTLDKLDSITGYQTQLSEQDFHLGINTNGYAMSGQTQDFVPADKKLYALRDAIGTVESIPLITASILSKKIAEGTKALVIDLKCGQGAFMRTQEQARELAQSLLKVGKELGLNIEVSMTLMDEPLGRMVGNFLEVEECIQELTQDTNSDLMQVTKHLSANLLCLAGVCPSFETAWDLCESKLKSQEALKYFWRNVELQGGDINKLKADLGTRRSSISYVFKAPVSGFISAMNSYEIGLASMDLGGGRIHTEDAIDYNAGLEFFQKRGAYVQAGEPLAMLYAPNNQKLEAGKERMEKVYSFSQEAVPIKSLIIEEFK